MLAPLMDQASFSQLLLTLYRAAGSTSIKEFRELALREVQQLLPFDGVMWTSSSVAGQRPSRYVWMLGGVSPEMLQLFDQHPDDDGALAFARETPGEPRVVRPEEAFPGTLMAAFSAYSGMHEVMILAQRSEALDRFTVLTFGRREGRSFDADDGAFMRLLVPHLEAMVMQNFEFQILATMVNHIAGEVGLAAVADEAIVLKEPRFNDLMARAWPDWTGPQLPAPLLQALRARKSFLSHGGAGFYLVPGDGVMLVIATPASALQTLSPKEFAIASEFAHGKSYKEVARSHGLSPETVRSRLRSVYEKLSISDKTALSRRFARTQLLEDLHHLL